MCTERERGAVGIPIAPVSARTQHATATQLFSRSCASRGHTRNSNSAASLGTFHDEKG